MKINTATLAAAAMHRLGINNQTHQKEPTIQEQALAIAVGKVIQSNSNPLHGMALQVLQSLPSDSVDDMIDTARDMIAVYDQEKARLLAEN
jgi:hypothetical protein